MINTIENNVSTATATATPTQNGTRGTTPNAQASTASTPATPKQRVARQPKPVANIATIVALAIVDATDVKNGKGSVNRNKAFGKAFERYELTGKVLDEGTKASIKREVDIELRKRGALTKTEVVTRLGEWRRLNRDGIVEKGRTIRTQDTRQLSPSDNAIEADAILKEFRGRIARQELPATEAQIRTERNLRNSLILALAACDAKGLFSSGAKLSPATAKTLGVIREQFAALPALKAFAV